MALCDYYLCDECGGKTFYDANVSYDDNNANPKTGRPWPDNVGWMRVLCLACEAHHATRIAGELERIEG
jgi:hypothetical protein